MPGWCLEALCLRVIGRRTPADSHLAREPLPQTIERLKATPKDPKTKYHRAMYPAWNDPQVHTDANGHQYPERFLDAYSVLAAFDPGHEVAHAVKKLLAAGTCDKALRSKTTERPSFP